MELSKRSDTDTCQTVDVDHEENVCLSLVGQKRSDIDTSDC